MARARVSPEAVSQRASGRSPSHCGRRLVLENPEIRQPRFPEPAQEHWSGEGFRATYKKWRTKAAPLPRRENRGWRTEDCESKRSAALSSSPRRERRTTGQTQVIHSPPTGRSPGGRSGKPRADVVRQIRVFMIHCGRIGPHLPHGGRRATAVAERRLSGFGGEAILPPRCCTFSQVEQRYGGTWNSWSDVG